MNHKVFLVLILFSILHSCKEQDRRLMTTSLNSNWKFKAIQDSVWRNAIVPGNVFTDLLSHDIIPDPFKQSNELEVQWVSDTFWEYQT